MILKHKYLPPQRTLIPLLWALAVLVSLIPIWQGKYFLTGDGPSHLYNARILSDWAMGRYVDFYSTFYFLDLQWDPNWTGHALLSLLLWVFPAFLAEKLFLSVYVLLFAGGCFVLLQRLNPQNSFLAILGLPFIYHFTFFKGFWNCALSLALAFWVIAWWLRYRKSKTYPSLLKGMLLLLLLYFTHLIGLMMAMSVMGGITCVDTLQAMRHNPKKPWLILWNHIKWLLISLSPPLLLIAGYLIRVEGNFTPGKMDVLQHLDYYVILNGLRTIGMTSLQQTGVKLIAFLFHGLLIWGIVLKLRTKTFPIQDGFFLAFLGVFCLYLFLPESIAGGSVLLKRIQIIPYLILLGWFSQFSFSHKEKLALSGIFALLTFTLIFSRLSTHHQVHRGLEEYLSVQNFIEPQSTVLPLSFNHYGVDELGEPLSDMWLFLHAADYLGAEKPLALLSNYEASSGAFPLVYRYERNPFIIMGTNEGIEFQPPSVNVMNYPQETGIPVDYLLTWCLDQADQTHPYVQEFRKQLEAHYSCLYTSPQQRAKLFQLKKGGEREKGRLPHLEQPLEESNKLID